MRSVAMMVMVMVVMVGTIACGGSVPPPTSTPPIATAPQPCTGHRVHGVLRDDSNQKPLGGVQLAVVGATGQDDATTDDNGRYDIRSTSPDRDRMVIFYVDNNVSRKLSTTRCDEELNLALGVRSTDPGMM